MSKYGHIPHNWFEALLNKMGGEERARQYMRDELVLTEPTWREEDGIIYLPSVTSDGTSGPDWIARLERKGFSVGYIAKQFLNSPNFKPTDGVRYKVGIVKGALFNDRCRTTGNIRAHAKHKHFTTPNAEVACLVRENFSDNELLAMGLNWIIAMHEPINEFDAGPLLLGVFRLDGGRWLDMFYGSPDGRWGRGRGFAFVVSQDISAAVSFQHLKQ